MCSRVEFLLGDKIILKDFRSDFPVLCPLPLPPGLVDTTPAPWSIFKTPGLLEEAKLKATCFS